MVLDVRYKVKLGINSADELINHYPFDLSIEILRPIIITAVRIKSMPRLNN